MYMLREKLPFITTGISVTAAINATHPPDRKHPLGWKMEPLPVGNQSTGELWRVQIQAMSSSWGKGADGMVTFQRYADEVIAPPNTTESPFHIMEHESDSAFANSHELRV